MKTLINDIYYIAYKKDSGVLYYFNPELLMTYSKLELALSTFYSETINTQYYNAIDIIYNSFVQKLPIEYICNNMFYKKILTLLFTDVSSEDLMLRPKFIGVYGEELKKILYMTILSKESEETSINNIIYRISISRIFK